MRLRTAMWALFAAYVVVLLTMTHLPHPPRIGPASADKQLHFAAYLIFGALGFSAAALTFPRQRGLVSIAIFVGGIVAILDESSQPLFNRHADVHDWGADMLGLVTACWFLGIIRWISARGLSEKTRAVAS